MDTNNSISKRNYYVLLSVVFVGFLVFGFSENIKGPAIPRIQKDFSLSEMQIGLLLALNALGYLLACSFTGVLTKKLGIKIPTLLAFGIMTISGVLIYISVSYPALSISYFLMYIGNGILEIALAILASRIFTKNTGTMMNLSHFFYGLSSTVAPIFSTVLMKTVVFKAPLGWRGMYLIMLSLSLIPFVLSFMSSPPENNFYEENHITLKEYIKDPAAWLLVLILTFGVVAELAVGGWLVNFLEKAYRWDTKSSSFMLSSFFFLFMLARLILGPVIDKIGFTKALMIFSAFSGICSIVSILIGQPAAFLFALAGAGIAPIYPTVMALLAKRYANNSDIAITFTVTLMGVGSIIGNFLVGAITNAFKNIFTNIYNGDIGLIRGLQAGYIFIGICALLCSLASLILYLFLKKRNQVI